MHAAAERVEDFRGASDDDDDSFRCCCSEGCDACSVGDQTTKPALPDLFIYAADGV